MPDEAAAAVTPAAAGNDVKISEAEAQLYDRQIRLWGLDAQKRLRSSRVLIAGMRGLGCEVAKNLVLSGIKSLKMMDTGIVTEEDFRANFLAPRSSLGSNRAESCIPRVQALNPMVDVTADATLLTAKPDDFFKDFDIVLATGFTGQELVKINSACRKNNVKFFAGDVHGFFGYSFMDLVKHEFVEEVVKKSNADDNNATPDASGDTGEPAAKKSKPSASEEETTMVKRSEEYVDLETALKVDWTEGAYKKRVRRMDPGFFMLHVLFEFHSREGRSPSESSRESDLALLERLRDSVTEKFSLPPNKLPSDLLHLFFSEVSPVAAIVGGVLGQEIIKVISNKDEPHNNFFVYNPMESAGVVEAVGY